MRRSAFRFLFLVFAVLVNLAIAERARAGLKSWLCYDDAGEPSDCCISCIFNCGCTEAPSR